MVFTQTGLNFNRVCLICSILNTVPKEWINLWKLYIKADVLRTLNMGARPTRSPRVSFRFQLSIFQFYSQYACAFSISNAASVHFSVHLQPNRPNELLFPSREEIYVPSESPWPFLWKVLMQILENKYSSIAPLDFPISKFFYLTR